MAIPGQVIEAGFTNPPATEAPPVETDVVAPPVGAGERQQAGGGQSGVVIRPAPERPKPTGVAKTPFTAKGTLTPQLTPTEAEIKNEAQQNIFRAERAQKLAELVAMGVSEQGLSDYANIGEMDALEARRLHVEHFDVARKRMDSLYNKVEEARSLRVNPYNWYQSIGRGGRVSAAFAVLTGQMAAGAGNPNSALKLLDAAIERDIAGQEQNIKQEFDTLKLQRDLTLDERRLFAEEIASLNDTRAVAYAAIQGRIAAAMQHAQNEAAYQSYNVMQDHYNVKLLESIQAARSEILRVEVDGPIRASKLRALQREAAQIQQQIQPGAEVTGPAPAEPSAPAAPPRAPGRAGAVAARRGRRPAAATPVPTGAIPQTPAPSGVEDEAIQMSVDTTPAAAPQPAAERPAADAPSAPQVARALKQGGAPDFVVEQGGYGRAEAAAAGFPTPTITRIDDAIAAYAQGRPIPGDGFADDRDAILFSDLIKDFPPQRENYATDAGYQEALAQHKFQTKRYEIFEQEGVQNTISTGNRTFRVKRTSTARRDDASGQKRYNQIADKLAEGQAYIRELSLVAENFRKAGPTGFFNAETGAFDIPGLNSTDEATKLIAQKTTTLAMKFIKSEDPTARLSDKDLEVGEKAMGFGFINGKINMTKLLDVLQSIDGDYTNNTVRQAMDRYLQKLAFYSQKAYYSQFENDLVPDYDTAQALAQEADDVQLWINRDKGQ